MCMYALSKQKLETVPGQNMHASINKGLSIAKCLLYVIVKVSDSFVLLKTLI